MIDFKNNKYNFENRIIVLELSVTIEDILSLLLSIILNINNRQNSLSLGTRSSALGFNSKTNLLIDMDYLEKNSKWKFQKFMEIRNQFAHNIKVETFEQCFLIVEGKDKLLKTYPSPNSLLSIEENLKAAVIELGFDIINLGKHIIKKFGDEYKREKILENLALSASALFTTLEKTLGDLTEKSDLREFLLAYQKTLPEENKKVLIASFEEKNKMLETLVPNSDLNEFIRNKTILDYFSDQEIEDYNLKQNDVELRFPM